MIRGTSKRIVYLEDKVNDLQYQIDCLSQMLGYLRTENDFVDFKYKGNSDIEDMLSSGDTGYYEPEEEDKREEPYP